ncbi:MAG: HAD family hydrolase [Phycisphaerales bacterium]|jgi:D,D-heptose 1,7-bisphosphate phosphatase
MSDKAIFLDRDDTLIEDPGYINNPEQVKLLDGVAEALIELKALGYKLVVVTNQSAVARGIVTEKVLGEIHNRLTQQLAEQNAFLDGIYYCPFHPDGTVGKYRKKSNLRKPNPGMLLKAAKEMAIDLEQSWCVGNSIRDIEAGLRAGCKTILIDLPSRQQQLKPGQPRPDHKAVNMKEVANIIKKYYRSHITEKAEASSEQPDKSETVPQVDEQISEEVEPELQANEQITEVTEPIPQNDEELNQSTPNEPQPELTEQNINGDRTEQMLNNILVQLKKMHRTDMFSEFSVMRLMAGIIQILALFCLLITVWFLISPNRQDSSVFIALGFAIVLQLMSLTFYIMHGRK